VDDQRKPDPDDPRKPDDPGDLSKRQWKGVLKRTVTEFKDDKCTDWAAALTYYGVLAIFPAIIAMVSLLGLVGDPKKTTDALIGIVRDLGPASAVETFQGPAQRPGQPAALRRAPARARSARRAVVRLGLRQRVQPASNSIYEIEEGRPFWKLRPMQILVTLVCVIMIALVARRARGHRAARKAVGDAVGWRCRRDAVELAEVAVLVLIVSLIFSLLYYAAPNVKQPKFRWFTLGGFVALVVWSSPRSPRLLRRQLRVLRQDLRQPRRGDQLPRLAVAVQHRGALRRRVQRRARARPPAPGRITEAEETIQLPARDVKAKKH
jgi:membrane protein